jgi:hypothetical protein
MGALRWWLPLLLPLLLSITAKVDAEQVTVDVIIIGAGISGITRIIFEVN